MSDTSLSDVFSLNANKRFVFLVPGGNWGDHLIYWGAECLAKSLGIHWDVVRVEDFNDSEIDSETVIYVHGGGGMNPWCSGRAGRALMRALGSRANTIIQGPTTYDEVNNYTSKFFSSLRVGCKEKDVTIFARESRTLEILRSHAPIEFNLGIDDDTAFHVSKSDFLERADVDEKRYNLCVIRGDNESAHLARDDCVGVRLDPAMFAKSFDHWLRIHAAAKSISTDRTHSSIAGAILKIPTVIYGGSYHKNRSIWEQSLARRGVTWGDARTLRSVSDRNTYSALKGVFARSWKVQQFKRWFYGVPSK